MGVSPAHRFKRGMPWVSTRPMSERKTGLRPRRKLVFLSLLLAAVSLTGMALPSGGMSIQAATGAVVAPPAAVSTNAPSVVGAANPTGVASVSSVHASLFPPIHPLAIGNCTTTPVVPGCGFSAEPAPMGIADYGVSGYGHPVPYAYGTTAFLGTVNWSTAYIYSSAQKGDFSVQLNVVLNFINDGVNYSYWIQNVPVPVDTTKNDFAMSYANNIWNFSCASTTCNLATNTVTGNGTDDGGVYIWPASANSGCAGGGTGTCDTLDGPSWFSVEVRTFLNPSGEPEVRFCYFDKSNPTIACYDTVTFGFAKDVTKFRGFFVDGFDMNPTGLFEDAELTIGGPGGGASTTNTGPSNIHMTLDYWNGHNFQATPSAWDAGDDTAEALSSDQSIFSNDGSGTPLSVQLNGTTREDFENPTYRTDQVGTLNLSAPSLASGWVAVGSTHWAYTNNLATLTLLPGTYHVWVNGTGGTSTDMGMCTITASTVTTVSTTTPCSGSSGGPLTLGTPTPSPSSVDVGQSVTFTAVASGGTGSYSSYAWTVSPATGLSCPATTTTGSDTCSASVAGTYTVNATVTDSGSVTSSPASSSPFTVYSDPTVTPPVPSSTSITLGQSVTFTTSLGVAGSGGDAYSWTASPSGTAGCTASTTTTYTCTPTLAGTYTATATVTDSNKGTGSATSAAVTVSGAAGPTVGVPTASPSTGVDVGQAITWSATVTGGTAPYTYAWSSSPAGLGCPTSGAPPLSCTPTAAGSYTLTLTVTDHAGNQGSDTSATYQVSADPTVSPPTFSLTTADVGQSVDVSTTITGPGSGGDTVSWASSPSGLGCPASGPSPISCTPTAAGSYRVTVTVKDSNGGLGTASSALFTVDALPSVTTPAATPSSLSVGTAGTIASTLSTPGSGGDSYAWTISPSTGLGCTTADALSIACTPSAVGTYSVTLTVTDSNKGTGSATATLTVGISGLDVSVRASPTTAAAGSDVSFSASISENSGTGGTYSYSWHFGDGSTSALAAPTHAYGSQGTYTVVLFVNDTEGNSGSASVQVSVTAAPASSSPSFLASLGPSGLLLLLLLVVVVVIVVVAVALRRKREDDRPPPGSYPPEAWNPGYDQGGAEWGPPGAPPSPPP